ENCAGRRRNHPANAALTRTRLQCHAGDVACRAAASVRVEMNFLSAQAREQTTVGDRERIAQVGRRWQRQSCIDSGCVASSIEPVLGNTCAKVERRDVTSIGNEELTVDDQWVKSQAGNRRIGVQTRNLRTGVQLLALGNTETPLRPVASN